LIDGGLSDSRAGLPGHPPWSRARAAGADQPQKKQTQKRPTAL